MRSSDIANSATIAISLIMSAREGSKSGSTNATAQTANSHGRQRTLRSNGCWKSISARSLAREQALRPPHQDEDHQQVNREGAHLRNEVLAGHIGNAEQQRGQKRPSDRRGAAN